MRKVVRSVTQTAPALIAVLLSNGCGSSSESAAPAAFERPPAPVVVAEATVRDVPIYLDEIGKCAARETVTVQPQVSGRITDVHFTDGAELRRGDLLFTIDPRPFQAELAAAEATLAQHRAALDLARVEFARIEDLVDSKAIPRRDYDARKNAVAVAEAQIKQSEAAIETARLNIEYTTIRSPLDGRAGERMVDAGNVVNANNTPLLIIQRLDPIYADFSISESELSRVQQNMARGTLRVEIRLPDEPDNPRSGQLTFLDNAVQDATGTVKLRATVANGDRRFWPGRFVKVRLILGTIPSAVLIPAAASQVAATGPFVYVVKDDSTAEMRQVELGQRQDDLVIVRSGVNPGEKVVVTGQLAVTPGGKVIVAPPPGQGAPSGAPPADAPAEGSGKQS
jgi:multidrug efflux system membrane fusion protein